MKYILPIIFILLLPIVIASPFSEISCSNQGVLRIWIKESYDPFYIESLEYGYSKNSLKTLPGTYKDVFNVENLTGVAATAVIPIKIGDMFQSDQIFTGSGDYVLKSVYKGAITYDSFTCPGVIFDCSLLNFTVKDCYTKDDNFYALVYFDGYNKENPIGEDLIDIQESFTYELKTSKSYTDINDNRITTGSLPKDYWISFLDNGNLLYQAPLKEIEVEYFKIIFNEFDNQHLTSICDNTKQYEILPYYSYARCRIEASDTITTTTTSTTTTTIKQEIVVQEAPNYTTPAIIISIALILTAIILRFKIKKKKR